MEQQTIDILKSQFNKLPESLQAFVVSDDFKENLKSIARNYNLDDKKLIVLENETLMVLLGLEAFVDLEENLVNNAIISQEQAQKITRNVFEKIITPTEMDLRAFLKKELQEENREQENIGEENRRNIATEEMKKVLRDNSKTTSIKNLIANLK